MRGVTQVAALVPFLSHGAYQQASVWGAHFHAPHFPHPETPVYERVHLNGYESSALL